MKKIVFIIFVIMLFLIGIAFNIKHDYIIDSKENKEEAKESSYLMTSNRESDNKIEEENNTKSFFKSGIDFSKLDNTLYSWSFLKQGNGIRPKFESQVYKIADKYHVIYLGNENDKKIYLTFDEGYENGYTSQILDVLKQKNVVAAFFITGPYISKEKDLVLRMVNEGHVVGNHTINHPSLPTIKEDEKIEKEILDLEGRYYELTGKNMKFIRPPKGEWSERTLAICSNLGYTNVMWSYAYKDWDTKEQKGVDYAKKMVLDNLHNGEVLLLHAVSFDNANALEDIIDAARNEGYTFESLENFS